MSGSEKCVSIAVIGDEGVGKTRFIRTCLAEEPVADDPSLARVLPPINLVRKDEVTSRFIDTCGSANPSEEEKAEFDAAVKCAEVIFIMYRCGPLNNEESTVAIRKNIRSWLQRVRALRPDEKRRPKILLVGTHLDQRAKVVPRIDSPEEVVAEFYEQVNNPRHDEQLQPILSEYPEVEGGFEISCELLINVAITVITAHKCVMYPMDPIYDAVERKLTPTFRDCLHRIFTLCDLDGDGALNDAEISAFNKRTFDEDIPAKSLEHVKRVAKYQNASFVDANDSIKFEGFCFWITIFAEKQEEDIPWQVLYEWGYNRYLELDPDFLFPEQDYKFGREVTDEDLLHPDPSIAEISASGIRFLESLFRRFKSPDNTMPISCVRTMFDSLSLTRSPQIVCPFDLEARVVRFADQANRTIDFNSFFALWCSLLDNTFDSLRLVARAAAFLGYVHDADDDALFFTWGLQTQSERPRHLYHALVFADSHEISRAVCGSLSGFADCAAVSVAQIAPNIFVRIVISTSEISLLTHSHYDVVICPYADLDSVKYGELCLNQIYSVSPLRSALSVLFVATSEKPLAAEVEAKSKSIRSSFGLKSPLVPLGVEFRDRFKAVLLSHPSDHRIYTSSLGVYLAGILVLAALAGGGYWFYTRKNGNDK